MPRGGERGAGRRGPDLEVDEVREGGRQRPGEGVDRDVEQRERCHLAPGRGQASSEVVVRDVHGHQVGHLGAPRGREDTCRA
jgi:hypothetical protein